MLALVGLASFAVVACGTDRSITSAGLDQVAPTRQDIARGAGIRFPTSTRDFRLTRIGRGQIDVSFVVATGDVDAFTAGSGVRLTPGRRAITHASPLWDVAVKGPVSGGSSAYRTVVRNVEAVPDGTTTTIRLSIVPRD
ncbi:MAG: hypothetical protein R2698_05620 [Microthrixaceae bacterium]